MAILDIVLIGGLVLGTSFIILNPQILQNAFVFPQQQPVFAEDVELDEDEDDDDEDDDDDDDDDEKKSKKKKQKKSTEVLKDTAKQREKTRQKNLKDFAKKNPKRDTSKPPPSPIGKI